jgi:glycosyltransferase involved in cell wall biosynthesis
MNSSPKLSILIATLGRRHEKFTKLVNHLLRQASAYPGQVEILAYWNNGELPIGKIRQSLLMAATGEYVCHIDDDDWVPDEYVKLILDSMVNEPDYIGFEVAFYNNTYRQPRVFHSLRYNKWSADSNGFYRNITHLNPIKREIALKGLFDGDVAEDERWATQVAPFVKTENYIDAVMYHYYHESEDSSFGGSKPDVISKQPEYSPAEIKDPHFKYIQGEQ